MDREQVWQHVHAERRALAEILADLPADAWRQPTLCPGWSVRDVAAHVISNPGIGWRQLPGMLGRNLGRGYNQMIFREVKRLGRRETPASILADFQRYDGSTRHVPLTSSTEPLIDALVHTQDILRPLGLRHDMPPDAAVVAADRCRTLSFLMGSRRLVRGARMVATDIDWQRGSGPTVTGPAGELLMLCAGRAAAPGTVSGDGLELLAPR